MHGESSLISRGFCMGSPLHIWGNSPYMERLLEHIELQLAVTVQTMIEVIVWAMR